MSGEKGGAPPIYPPQYGQPPPQNPPPGYDSVPQYQPYGAPSGVPMNQGGQPHYQVQMIHGQVLMVPPPQTFSEPPPPDYMNRAIFTTICCFWPVGIFAIMKASEAKNAYARGDFQGAKSYSDAALRLSNVAIFAGIASIVVFMIIVGVYVGLVLTNIRSY